MRPAVVAIEAILFGEFPYPGEGLVTGGRERELLGRYEENAYFMLTVAGHREVTLYELQG